MRSLLLILQSGCFDVFLLYLQMHVNFLFNEPGSPNGVDNETFPTVGKHSVSFDWKITVGHLILRKRSMYFGPTIHLKCCRM